MVYTDRNCGTCGIIFSPTSSNMRFCCWVCRFKSKVPNNKNQKDCWDWPESINKVTGYGQFNVCARPIKMETAHRISFEIFKEKLFPGDVVRHKCDNRACFNPDHLEKGTFADNSHDMVLRKRHRVGEAHHIAILTEQEVLEIRNSKEQGIALALKYGVKPATIYQVKARRSWKHI